MALTFAKLYTRMISHVGSFPKGEALQRLYLGAQMFFQRSEIWFYDETQNIVADQTDYTLGVPAATASAQIQRIRTVWYGEDSDDKVDTQIVDNDKYDFEYPNQLVFRDAYTEALTDGLTTRVVLVPTVADHEVTDEMMDRWGMRGIRAWAIWSIVSEDNEPWSNERKARDFQDMYRNAVAEASLNRFKQNKSGEMRVIPRPFV